MRIRIVPFEQRYSTALRRFMEVVRSRPSSDGFFRWRYLECPSRPCAWLAVRGDECLAMLGAFEKTWYMGGEVVPVIETRSPETRVSWRSAASV